MVTRRPQYRVWQNAAGIESVAVARLPRAHHIPSERGYALGLFAPDRCLKSLKSPKSDISKPGIRHLFNILSASKAMLKPHASEINASDDPGSFGFPFISGVLCCCDLHPNVGPVTDPQNRQPVYFLLAKVLPTPQQ